MTSTLIVGPAGSGATSSQIIPGVLSETGRRSVVCTDVGGELLRATHAHSCRVFGPENVLVLDPLDVRSEIAIGRLRQAPTALYVPINLSTAHALEAPVATFFSRLFRALLEPDGASPGMHAYLDNLALIGRIPNLERMLTVMRSRGFSCSIAVHSVEELRRIYGPAGAEAIGRACAAKIALSGTSGPDADGAHG